MVIFPNAKINLGLNIIEKRSDGYHNLETVFYPVQWRDVLEIIPSQCTRLTMSGIPVDGNVENNLVMKALRLLQRDFQVGEFAVYLQKNIPFGAGLGGGSADGACMLSLVNKYCELNLSEEELAAYAVQLGADCPFFIYNRPVFASGIGDVMIPADVSLDNYKIVVVKPEVVVSTAEAYSMIIPRKPDVAIKSVLALPVEEWKSLLVNDFEVSVFVKYPELKRLKEQLYSQGAVYAAMSGSGSALFGIFPASLQPNVEIPGCRVWIEK